ncbi:AAA family ATPase [Sandarakinorhabdus sp. DWP1-3-1]|uniref:AAA family ATPase n=1 Tax=Sandarakinorhabdus sp. DWP1-3-1 TaxID=2804627 RepID=UPI003CF386C6
MSGPPDPDAAPFVARAKRYAALSGPFEPIAALRAAAVTDAGLTTLVASALAAACDTDLENGSRWLIRSGERRFILDRTLKDRADLLAAVAERRAQDPDQAAADLLAALAGDGAFTDTAVADALSAPTPDRPLIERIVAALDRAGLAAPAGGRIVDARQALSRHDRQARRSGFEARGFFGRESETAALIAWLEKPLVAPPVRAAYIAGNPGIGKSALLEEVTGRAGDARGGIVVRLDFDRAGLDVNDLLGLTMELARQIADRLGDAGKPILEARLRAASVTRGEESYGNSSRGSVPPELAAVVGAAVRTSGRPVLLVLDTVEVLRARGEEHPERLFRWLDTLLAAGLRPLAVLAAGRGNALDSAPGRVGLAVPLDGLDGPATDALLVRLAVPPEARAAITDLANGNPLVLRLAATVVREHGVGELPQGMLDKDVAAAFLYRILLSRIDDPELRRLAHPGLLARRISAAFLGEVLAPALGLPPLAPGRAETLFNALAGQLWLVQRDPVARDFVIHRSDMRAILLPLLYRDQPKLCEKVDAAAAAWFARQNDAQADVDAAYHRLQLMRFRDRRPAITTAVAQRFDPATLAELPPEARDLVAGLAGRRSSQLRKGGEAPTAAAPIVDDAALAAEVLNLIDREDWAEGQFVVDQMATAGGLDPRRPAAMAIRAFYWRSGRWQRARRMFAERDRMVRDDTEIFALPLPLAIARFEIRAEFTRPRLRRMLALPGIDALIAQAMRSAGPLARQGALAFVLAANGHRQEPLWSSKDGDAVAAALDSWIPAPDGRRGQAPATAHAYGVVRERLGARGLVSAAAIEWNDLQMLVALSPYPVVAANLAVMRGNDRLIDAARAADARLSQAGGLLSGSPLGLGPVAANPIAGIAGLGLFAEWAGAEAWRRRDPDLGTLAAAAERWRRTIAGRWSYDTPPPGWQGEAGADIIIRRRVQKLANFDDPADWALRQLALWDPADDGPGLLARLRRRHGGVLAAVAALPDPVARAGLLLDHDIPSAFVPPLAILTGDLPHD